MIIPFGTQAPPGVETKTFDLGADTVIDGVTFRAGQRVTMAVSPAQSSNQDETLQTYLGGYANRQYVADLISPPVLVDREAGKRRDHSATNAFAHIDTRAGRQGGVKEIQHASELVPYQTQEYALAAFIPWASENDADANYRLRQSTSTMLMNKLMLDREIRVKDHIFNPANYASAVKTALTTNFRWEAGSTKDIPGDIQRRIEASAMPVSFIVVSPRTARVMFADSKVRDLMRSLHGDDRQTPDTIIAASASQQSVQFTLVGFPPFLIAPAKVMDNATGALSNIWDGDVALVSTASGYDENEIASVMTFRHRGRSGSGIITNEYMPYGRGINGGTMLEVGFGETIFSPSNITGGLIEDVTV